MTSFKNERDKEVTLERVSKARLRASVKKIMKKYKRTLEELADR